MNWITRNNFTVRRKFNMSNTITEMKGNCHRKECEDRSNNIKYGTKSNNAGNAGIKQFKSNFYTVIGKVYVYVMCDILFIGDNVLVAKLQQSEMIISTHLDICYLSNNINTYIE